MKIVKTTCRLLANGDKKTRYIQQLGLVIIIGLLNVASAYALGMVTDSLSDGGYSLANSFWFFAATLVTIALMEWFRSVRITRLTEAAESNYRKITARSLLRAEYASIQKLESGDLISRVVSDCRFAASNSELLINGVRNVVIPVMLIVVMFLVDWRVGFGYLIPLIPVLLYPTLSKRSLSEIPAFRKSFAAMTAQAKDLIVNRTTVKAYRLEDKADAWVGEAAEDYRRKGVRGIGKIYTANISALAINVLPMFGCALMGAYLAYHGLFTIDKFVVALMLASVATEELLKLPNILVNYPSGIVAGGRLFELWDLPKEKGGTQTEPQSGPAVTFTDVVFRYPDQDAADAPLLDGITFTVQRGEKVALVGHSGCGKSTVLKLITGLLRPQSGTVTVLGRPVEDWDLEALRNRMSVLQQDAFVFQGTLKDNVLLGKSDADDQALNRAASFAKLSQWIEQQPDGWQVDTGEHGSLLSGGLRQRVGFARLFLKKADIELMDEATSALDATYQKEIMDFMREYGKGKTRIIVAHRLSTVTDADHILFIQNGKITESGTHAQLLKKRGAYYKLYTAQEKGEQDAK
ncbi:MAG TPA: ABC transporter ATP-binding protein [Candidatus Limiplasma sp.]|nr:ABC transporter ATP-binding protein [Candidatus Limiplasma sp.]